MSAAGGSITIMTRARAYDAVFVWRAAAKRNTTENTRVLRYGYGGDGGSVMMARL